MKLKQKSQYYSECKRANSSPPFAIAQEVVFLAIEIKKKNGTHILRHSGATFRLKNGENIRIIQKMLGHTTITSTEKYLHYNEDDVKNMIDRSPKLED